MPKDTSSSATLTCRGGDAASGHAELTSTHVDLRRFDLVHSVQSCHSPCYQLVGLEFYAVGGFRLNALLQGLKLRTELYVLAEMVGPFIPVFADVTFDLVGRQQVNHRECEITIRVWKIESKPLTSWIKGGLDV